MILIDQDQISMQQNKYNCTMYIVCVCNTIIIREKERKHMIIFYMYILKHGKLIVCGENK